MSKTTGLVIGGAVLAGAAFIAWRYYETARNRPPAQQTTDGNQVPHPDTPGGAVGGIVDNLQQLADSLGIW